METKWIVALSAVIACLVSSALAWWMFNTAAAPLVTIAPGVEPPPVAFMKQPIAPPAPVPKKPAPPATPKYSVILPVGYPVGMYDWFGHDQHFYRTYPDRRWVVHPWHRFRQPGYPDRVYRA